MTILIAVASRHGSTREIAEAIADELRAAGHAVDVRGCDEALPVEPYDAAIVGSALYLGAWLPAAREFVQRHRAWLAGRPVWLFSSGPLDNVDPSAPGQPADLDELMAASGARGQQVFVGKLDKSHLGPIERLVIRMVKAPEGDFRDWAAIRAWGAEIARELSAAAPSASA
jgi:menaquinone-dependent protoporphyrinogen oxidase